MATSGTGIVGDNVQVAVDTQYHLIMAHKAVLDAMQNRLDRQPDAMGLRRQTIEHVFGTFKAWAGSTPFLTRTLKKVRTEMSLAVLAYNMKRMIQLFGVGPLQYAIRTRRRKVDLISTTAKVCHPKFHQRGVFTRPRSGTATRPTTTKVRLPYRLLQKGHLALGPGQPMAGPAALRR
jgi:hypothetical protein